MIKNKNLNRGGIIDFKKSRCFVALLTLPLYKFKTKQRNGQKQKQTS